MNNNPFAWAMAGLFGRRRNEAVGADPAAPGNQGGEEGHLVPAGTSISQILDYVHGTADTWPFELYQIGLPVTRDIAVTYPTFSRCVTLTSGGVAELVAGGGLRVVDAMGRTVRTRGAMRTIELLSESPDGVTPAWQFVEDAVVDYATDGNFLLTVDWTHDRQPRRLRRMSPWDADMTRARDGTPVYRLTPVDEPGGTEYRAALEVIHGRWPRVLRYARTRSTREGFALAPVVAMRPSLDIGLQADRFIRSWFRDPGGGARGRLHIDAKQPEGKVFTKDQRLQIRDYLREAIKGRGPLVTFDSTATNIQDSAEDAQTRETREWQIMEVARYYGAPPPLIGAQVTEWGSGIEELTKLWWKFGLRDHVRRFLAPAGMLLLPRGQRFDVDPTAFLRGDGDSIQKILTAVMGDAQRRPVATIQEGRRIAGLPVQTEEEEEAMVEELREWTGPAGGSGGGSGGGGGGAGGGGGGDSEGEGNPAPPPGPGLTMEDVLADSEGLLEAVRY